MLATVKLQINALEQEAPELMESENYQKAESYIDEACTTIREIAHNLTPTVLEQNGLEAVMENMCIRVATVNKIQIDYIPFGLEKPIPEKSKIEIYRITQELLRNIIKHADANNVIVQITNDDGRVDLVVEDDGKGFDKNAVNFEKGIGIDNIQSRVAFLGGHVDIDSEKGEGTTFSVHIPN